MGPIVCCCCRVLDLSHCQIVDENVIFEVLAHMPRLRVLHLMGNPFIKGMRNYRKRTILSCAALTYLDDRPVREEERLCAVAWYGVRVLWL